MRKIQIFFIRTLLIGVSTILFLGCGVTSSRPEKPSVYIAEEFLEVLQQERNTSEIEDDIIKNNNELESSESTGEAIEASSSTEETETTTTPLLKQPEFIISELSDEDKLEIMERTIGTVLQCVPEKIYYSRASFEKTSEFAIKYLQKMVSLYERDYVVSYGEITGTSYTNYVCWQREKVGYYLDVLFGGQFSEYDLVCDGDALLYYNEQYYIGIPNEVENYHVTVQYDKEDIDRSDFVYIMLEEDNGRERKSGQVAISVIEEKLDYADRYIFEMIIEEE